MPETPLESALIVVVPEAEPAVAEHRARYDYAAQDGVPAHVTVLYPFKPVADLTEDDHRVLRALFAGTPDIPLRLSTTAWFGEAVLYLAPDDPAPLKALTDAVVERFPDFQPYGGVYDEVHPHLTVGDHASVAELQAAEQQVRAHLPVTATASAVELWSGPAVTGGQRPRGTWRSVERYPLGG